MLVVATPFATATVTGVPMMFMPFKIVNVSLPSLILVAPLVTVALRVTVCEEELNVADVLEAAVAESDAWRAGGRLDRR